MERSARGVLFDLFGTLVPCFPMRRHDAVLVRCAGVLGLDPDVCRRDSAAAYTARCLGRAGTFADQLRTTAAGCGLAVDEAALPYVTQAYDAFVAACATPVANVLAVLDELIGRGIAVGLVSNCNPDVAAHLRRGPLASRLSAWALSCELGVAKPSAAIYLHALAALGLPAADVLFVGDGSDEELAGARACGLTPVLVRADVSDSYDPVRTDVEGWPGVAVSHVSGVIELLACIDPVD